MLKTLTISSILFFILISLVDASLLFEDNFENGLSKWDTHLYPITSQDPLNSSNHVLTFTQSMGGGDIFSKAQFVNANPSSTFTMTFDYLSTDDSDMNGGGFVGIALDGVRDLSAPHTWLLGNQNYGAVDNLPMSNGQWVTVNYTFSTGYPQFYLMLEDYRSPGEDAFFDNFRLYDSTPIPESTTIVLFGLGLICLVGINRKKYKYKTLTPDDSTI